MTRFVFSLSAILVASLGLAGAVRAAEPFDAFLEKHCISCHGPKKEKGDLRIDQLSRDFKLGGDAHRWADMVEQVNSGEMPPKKEKQPTQEEIATFVTSLDSRLKEGRAARMAARPAVAHYRLSRKEYQNTVYDLLGVRYDPTKPGELLEDTRWHGFERLGSELTLSPSHVDRFYRAAGTCSIAPFPPRPARRTTSARRQPSCATATGRNNRRRWTGSGSNGRCVTCSSRALCRMRSPPTGLERAGRSRAGFTKSASKPAESVRPAANPRT